MFILIVLLGKNLGFLETDSYLDHDIKTTSVLLFCITPIFLFVSIILWPMREMRDVET